MNKYFNYIVIGLLIILFVQGFFKPIEGVSEEEVLYRIKVNELTNKNIELLTKNNDLELKLNSFENDILKNDSIVSSYSTNQLDSAFADYFNR